MKKYLLFLSFLLAVCSFWGAIADSEVHVIYGETYYCGDSLEVRFVGEPVFTDRVTRSPGSKVVQAKSGKEDILVKIRVQVRNMSADVFKGLDPSSFTLVGYIRSRPLSYLPEIMEPFDYGGKGFYTMYDKMYYKDYLFAPLRKIDMLLVYRINPIVRDLELHISPKGTGGTDKQYLDASYGEMNLVPCDGVFQFITLHDEDTGELTKYYR